MLLEMYKAGSALQEIAETLGRPLSSIKRKTEVVLRDARRKRCSFCRKPIRDADLCFICGILREKGETHDSQTSNV